MSYDVSLSRSFPSYIAASLIMMYSAGVGMVPKGQAQAEKGQYSHNFEFMLIRFVRLC